MFVVYIMYVHIVIIIGVVYPHSSSQKDENNTCYHLSARLGEEEGFMCGKVWGKRTGVVCVV